MNLNEIEVEWLGGIDDELHFSSDDLYAALRSPQELRHSEIFTGRPGTKIFADEFCVVKLREDYVFQNKDAAKRGLYALGRDRCAAVYHPSKTWFILREGDSVRLGNIAPRLHALHQYFKHSKTDSKTADFPQVSKQIFCQLFDLYFSCAAQDLRLDEGLSNFGLDQNSHLYYLDDDTYPWDEFVSLSNMLGVWFRQLLFIDTNFAEGLAVYLVEVIHKHFASPHMLRVFTQQLKQVNCVSEREKSCFKSLIQVLDRSARQAYIQSKQGGSNKITDKLELSTESLTRFSADKIAVLADIHANFPALQAVLNQLDGLGVEEILVLGDVVGYGPHPQQCIAALSARPCMVIQGNHDYATATGDTQRGFSKLASWGIDWTRQQLNPNYLSWLAGLNPVYYQDDWMAVHGAPIDKYYFYAYVYQMTYQANLDWLVAKGIRCAFHGHSHIQGAYILGAQAYAEEGIVDIDLQKNKAQLCCPGSVGQARGGQHGARFAIFDRQQKTWKNHCLQYDVSETVADMKRLNFPVQLYERLQRAE